MSGPVTLGDLIAENKLPRVYCRLSDRHCYEALRPLSYEPRMDRRHARQAIDRPAKIFISGGEDLICRIRDISKGGAKIRIAWTGWLPDSFDLEDSFTKARREVWVVWREASYVGVRFTDESRWPAVDKPRAFGRRQAS